MVLDEPQENDIVEEINGIRVAVEQAIKDHTQALTLEVQETPEGKGLVLQGLESDCC